MLTGHIRRHRKYDVPLYALRLYSAGLFTCSGNVNTECMRIFYIHHLPTVPNAVFASAKSAEYTPSAFTYTSKLPLSESIHPFFTAL